jgi:hypothetical protein
MPDGRSSLDLGPWIARWPRLASGRLAIPLGVGVLLAGISTLTNLGTQHEFIGYDAGVSLLDPTTNAQQLHVWDSLYAPGSPSPLALMATPWVAASEFLAWAGLSSLVTERLAYFGLILAAFVGSYALVALIAQQVFRYTLNGKLKGASIIAALWYTFNPYSMLLMTFPSTPHELTWALVPLGLWVVIRCVTTRGSVSTALFGAFLWSLIFSGSVASSAVSIVIAIVLVVASLLVRPVRSVSPQYRNIVVLIALTAILTCYFWLPIATVQNPISGISRLGDLSTNVVEAARFNSLRTSVVNLLRLDGSIALPEQAYFSVISSGWPLAASVLLPLAAVSAAFVTRGKRRLSVFLICAMGLVFLFLSKGEHPPLGQPMTWLYANVPVMGVFRNNYDKFLLPLVICEVLLLSVAVLWMLNLKELARYVWLGPTLLAVSAFPFLFLIGSVADHRYLVDLPQSYRELRGYLQSQATLPTIFTGPDFGGRVDFTWYQSAITPDPVLLGVPAITEEWLRSSTEPSQDTLSLLPQLGARYLLIHKDVLPVIHAGPYAERLEVKTGEQIRSNSLIAAASAQPDLHLVKDDPYFALFEYCNAIVRPGIYITRNVVTTSTGQASARDGQPECSAVSQLGFATTIDEAPSSVQTSGAIQALRREAASPGIGSSLPIVRVVSSSPGHEIVQLRDVHGPFLLVYSQTFDPQWRATLVPDGGQANSAKLEHVHVDQYLNGWVGSADGNYIAEIQYGPEQAAEIGSSVSKAGVALGVLLILVLRLRRRVRPSVPRSESNSTAGSVAAQVREFAFGGRHVSGLSEIVAAIGLRAFRPTPRQTHRTSKKTCPVLVGDAGRADANFENRPT